MRKWAVQFFSVLMLTGPLVAYAAAPANPPYPTSYTLDPNHTYVLWHATHFNFSTQTGKFRANGTLIYDEKKPKNSQVTVTIQIADLATGVPEFNKHLSGNLFFNAEKFPVMTFKSTKIIPIDSTHATVVGDLTLLGVTKTLPLAITLNKMGISPVTEKYTIGFSGKTKLRRSEYGMISYIPNVSDEINIDIQAEAIRNAN